MTKAFTASLIVTASAAILMGIIPAVRAQQQATETGPTVERKKVVNTTHSEVRQAVYHGLHKPDLTATKWKRHLEFYKIDHSSPENDVIAQKKLAKWQQKQAFMATNPTPQAQTLSKKAEAISLGKNFLGNEMENGTPPDNAMAISNDGIIVAADNYSIAYYDENGSKLYEDVHFDFFAGIGGLQDNFFDPRVIYDVGSDRFVFLILHGDVAATSKIMVCCSQTNDPQDGWHIYELPGNPKNNNSWLDYPNIGYSDDELFITGNLFESPSGTNNFREVVLFQVNKTKAYNGFSLDYLLWSNIKDGHNNAPFTIVPAPPGNNFSYGPGIYMVSNVNAGGKWLYLYHLNDDMNGNPEIISEAIEVDIYDVAADEYQKGVASDPMDLGDCRIQNAIFKDGYVHMVWHGDTVLHQQPVTSSFFSQIYYARIKVSDGSVQHSRMGVAPAMISFAYPSVASFSVRPEDQTVMIGFLAVGNSIYPETRAVVVGDDMSWSDDILVHVGQGAVDLAGGPNERWGDYSAAAIRFNATEPTVWYNGCYGDNTNNYNSWIAEIKGNGNGPQAGFTTNVTSGSAPLAVTFANASTNATAYIWDLGNGTISTQETPPAQVYTQKGTYFVKLTAINNHGTDEKLEFILVDVLPGVQEAELVEEPVKVFPNPVVDYFTLEFITQKSQPTTISILDASGKTVKVLFNGHTRAGKNVLTFNQNALSSGTYFVQVKGESNILKHEKIIIAK